jgi:uncharacterized membrane protein
MKHHLVSRLAIWLLAIIMIIFGIHHFRHPKDMLVYVPSYIPGGIVWVYFVGIAFILAGLAFIVNRFVSLAGYLLAVLLLIFVIIIHWPNYHGAGDAEMRQMAFVNMLKDTALAAFALYVAVNAKHQRLNTDE